MTPDRCPSPGDSGPIPRPIKWVFLLASFVLTLVLTTVVIWVVQAWARGVDPPFDQSLVEVGVALCVWAPSVACTGLIARSLVRGRRLR